MTSTDTLPGMVPFLPLIYVAWADGELTADELGAFRAAIHRQPGIDAPSLAALDRWLDPGAAAHRRRSSRTCWTASTSIATSYLRPGSGNGVGEVASALGMPYEEVVRELLGCGCARGARRPLRCEWIPRRCSSCSTGLSARRGSACGRCSRQPAFRYRHGLGTEAYRRQVFEWLQLLAREGFGARGLPVELGGGGDLPGFLAAFETLGTHDQSLTVKFGVQFGLFAGSIYMLGTERHHRWLREAASGALPGCFAMSELDARVQRARPAHRRRASIRPPASS